ncbi:MAG: restriction endonuclease subunit S [Alphaproteobacteria bacterium]|nr:MAG: restriction endonuclease subunit S [Alphaproteobacteria bacterium]
MKPYQDYKPSGVAWLGDVPHHWHLERLKFFARFAGGGTPSKGEPSYWGGDIPWISPKDMKRPLIDESEDYITATGQTNSPCTLIPPNSVLIVVRSGILQHTIPVALNTVTVTLNQDMRALIPNDRVESRYLAYQINGCQKELREEWVKQGATVESIEHQRMVDSRMAVPPLAEQQAIADYLDSETARIDELIYEKDELITLLREWRRTVIADFTAGVSHPGEKKPTGNIHLPKIPADWAMVRLGKYARIGNGSTPLKDNIGYWDGGTFPWLNSAVVNQNEVQEGSEYVTEHALQACHLPIVEPKSLLIALTGQGKTRGQVAILRIRATINQHLAYLDLDSEHFNEDYLFWTMTGMYGALRMVSDGQGGTKGALTCDDLSRFEVPKPPLDEQKKIASRLYVEAAKIDDLIAHTKDEITLLKELRAATIADAVLGRVDVRTVKQ